MTTLAYYLAGIRGLIKQRKAQKSKQLDEIAENLIRNTHSIEKGLCLANPKLGFGHKKQQEMITQIQALKNSKEPLHIIALQMALDALQEYLEYHKSRDYADEFQSELSAVLGTYEKRFADGKMGGTSSFQRENECDFNIESIQRFINSRHSIRDFSEKEIDDSQLEKALLLAEKAPSACNRQAVRAYVICGAKMKELAEQLPEVGGFADSAKRFIVITGKNSAYRIEEINQYIVSASMYAAYLTLTLHLYGFGSCIIQRPVIWTNTWEKLRKDWKIEADEQVVCMLAVGMLKDECKVPLSHRLGKEIYTFVR